MVVRGPRIYAQAADAPVFHHCEKEVLEVDAFVEAAGGRRAAFEIRLCERWMADGSTNLTRLAAWSGAATRSHRHSRSSFPTDTARLQAGHRRILHRRAEAMNAVVLNDASVLAEFFVEIRGGGRANWRIVARQWDADG